MTGETLPPPTPPDSLVYKLRFTPLRDVLRGRLTARMDLERLIARSELSPALQDLIRTTVRKTRLRWHEKADVARELIAHFRDGIDAGQMPDSLLQQFGDIAVAAKLIRRARKRQRSIFYRATVRTIQYGFLLIVGTYLLLTVRYYWGSTRLTRNYLKEFNAPILATPEQDRAWPIYRRAFLATSPWPKDEEINCESPTSPGWTKLVEYIAANQDALQLYREAAAKPALGMALSNDADVEVQRHNQEFPMPSVSAPPVDKADNPPLISVLLPNLSPMRFGGRLLRADALLAAEQGDGKRAVDDISAMLAMADHCAGQPTLISDLVSIAIVAQAAETIEFIASWRPAALDDAAWVGVSHRLAALRGGTIRLRLDGERAFFHDTVQRYYTDDGRGDGHLRPGTSRVLAWTGDYDGAEAAASSVVAGPIFSAVVAGRREIVRKYDELMGLVEQEAAVPLWLRDVSRADAELERMKSSTVQQARYLWIAILFPSLSRANYMFEIATQQRDATLVAIALELYHRKNGGYPPTLDALVPQYLPAVPPDRFDGKPIKYKLLDGKPLLYSVGVNRTDDGGILAPAKSRTQANQTAKNWIPPSGLPTNPLEIDKIRGDWILWPPVEDAP